MRLAFVLYNYFPFGGLSRDFVRISQVCLENGHDIDTFVMEREGDSNHELNMEVLPCSGASNHAKVADFQKAFNKKLNEKQYDAVIGFNKMPNLDVYYAADPCYIDRFADKSFWHKLNPRYRFYAGVEEAVFGVNSQTVCLMISDVQTELFKKHYRTPSNRLLMMPPGIDQNRRRPLDADDRRRVFREAHQLNEEDLVVLMVGSFFKTKGVDRAIKAMASLPQTILSKTHLMIVGDDDSQPYEQDAKNSGIADRVHFMGGRTDVPDFLLGADMLLHSARKENTGTVILEAMVAGLPVLVTDVCGYAKHVKKSEAGLVIPSPFQQETLNEMLIEMLASESRGLWSECALNYANAEDLYSMPEKAAEVIEQVARKKHNAV